MRTARILWKIQKSILLNLLMNLQLKALEIRRKLKMNRSQKNQPKNQPTKKKKSQEEEPKSEKVQPAVKVKKENLPPYPETPEEEEKKKTETESGPGIAEPEEDLKDARIAHDLVDICGDILDTGFGLWHDYNPNVPPLADGKRKRMEGRMARIVRRYDLDRYFKDEIVFFGLLTYEVAKRVRIKKPPKKNAKDHPGKTRERQDHPSAEPH